MLSASAYSFRMKARLAISLSWVAGFTNVITFMVCNEVVSHTTGNSTHFGRTLVEWITGRPNASGEAVGAFYFGTLLVCFLIGAVLSAVMIEIARRRGWKSKYVLPMSAEALLLTILAIVFARHQHITPAQSQTLFLMTAIGSVAMGLQNATITRISGAVVRTTHLTGVITDIGLEGVQLMFWYWDRLRTRLWKRFGRVLRVSQRHPSAQRVVLLASIVGSFIFGACLGAFLWILTPGYAMGLPIGFLGWIVFVDLTKPIADVKEIDLLGDAELRTLGLVESLLPKGMGVYRLSHHRSNRMHHAPDFQAWVDRLPERWQVTVLALSPWTSFDHDAVADLRMAIERLHRAGRELVISGVNPRQYKTFATMGLTDVINPENICPDLEFGIARAIGLVDPALARPA